MSFSKYAADVAKESDVVEDYVLQHPIDDKPCAPTRYKGMTMATFPPSSRHSFAQHQHLGTLINKRHHPSEWFATESSRQHASGHNVLFFFEGSQTSNKELRKGTDHEPSAECASLGTTEYDGEASITRVHHGLNLQRSENILPRGRYFLGVREGVHHYASDKNLQKTLLF